MKKRNDRRFAFFKGVGVLTAAAVAVKFLSVLYRIPLTRILGAVGLGTYQSAFPTYALIITLTGGGLTAAVSKCCADCGQKTAVKAAVICALCISVPVSAAAAALSGFIAAMSGCKQAARSLAVLLPSVPVSAVTAAIRGGFIGTGNTKASAVGQITEQTVKICAGLGLAAMFARYGAAAAAAGAAAGVAVGEISHLLYCILVYKHSFKKEAVGGEQSEPYPELSFAQGGERCEIATEILPRSMINSAADSGANVTVLAIKNTVKQILKVALPITLGLTVLPLCRVLDSFTAVNVLIKSGAEASAATALYGVATGAVNAVINMPSVLTAAVTAVLLPKISQAEHCGKPIASTAVKAVAFCVAAGAAAAAAIGAVSGLCMKIIAGGCGVSADVSGKMLKYECVCIPFIAAVGSLSAVLQGADKAYLPTVNLFISGAVKQITSVALLPVMGIYGFITAEICFYFTAAVLDGIAVAVYLKKRRAKLNKRAHCND